MKAIVEDRGDNGVQCVTGAKAGNSERLGTTLHPNARVSDPFDAAAEQALTALRSSLVTLRTLRQHIGVMAETAIAALTEQDPSGRAILSEEYDDLRYQAARLITPAANASFDLLSADATALRVPLRNGGVYVVAPFKADPGADHLSLPVSRTAFSTANEIDQTLAGLDTALARLDRAALMLQQDYTFLQGQLPQLTTARA